MFLSASVALEANSFWGVTSKIRTRNQKWELNGDLCAKNGERFRSSLEIQKWMRDLKVNERARNRVGEPGLIQEPEVHGGERNG